MKPLLAKLLLLAGLALALAGSALAVPPVEFTFGVPAAGRDPFAREIWAEVSTPSHHALRLPAFYAGNDRFTVRACAAEAGEYRLGAVTEGDGRRTSAVAAKPVGPSTVTVHEVATRRSVRTAPGSPPRFAFSDGSAYVPIGADLAWAPKDPVAWYRDAFRQFAANDLNWTRIWMCHWGRMNLDWIPEDMGPSPAPGSLDPRIAANWDAVIAAAEDAGVYVQVVLQHHGQFVSRGDNANWRYNPWNAANPGGFLHTASEFFTSRRAVELTRQKYRYIVARWGYSPAVLSWELFNEVHWVDALAIDHDVRKVARWHTAMARYIRSVDTYRHLVTTSTEDLRSPIYEAMDYDQPHLYATNMLAAARRFDVPPADLDRPVFYGEMGDDHMDLPADVKEAGAELPPIVWASLMGEGRYPAQTWEGDRLLAHHRLGELGAVARFLASTRLAERDGLEPFSAAVADAPMVPFVLEPGETWHRRPPLKLTVPMDGRQIPELALVPRILVGSPGSVEDGFPDRMTFRVDYPRPATARLHLADAASLGAAVTVRVDGDVAGQRIWPALRKKNRKLAAPPPPRPVEIDFPVKAGEHEIEIQNTGGADWIALGSLDLGLDTPELASIGRRGKDFIVLWVWHREGVYAVHPPPAVTGKLLIGNVPAGTWQATWWDTLAGHPSAPVRIEHPGGALALPTPPISRHAAVVLIRTD